MNLMQTHKAMQVVKLAVMKTKDVRSRIEDHLKELDDEEARFMPCLCCFLCCFVLFLWCFCAV